MRHLLEQRHFHLKDEAAMQQLGKDIASALPTGSVITLSGELGTGKSVLVRAFIHAMGYSGRVKSPTYTLIETYESTRVDKQVVRIAHLDLYRLADPDELNYLGFDDVLDDNDYVFIEWPERGAGYLPLANLHISISYADNGGRDVEFTVPVKSD